MATADEQIRVSDRVKRELDQRRREGESYNDVLERLLPETTATAFEEGFGILTADEAESIREQREAARDDRKDRTRRLEDA